MKELKFKNRVFKEGRNLTVRRGVKWDGEVEAIICTLEINHVYLQTVVMRFADLTDDDLAYEHDEGCRTVKGLLAIMYEVYPGFDRREIVTLVSFEM